MGRYCIGQINNHSYNNNDSRPYCPVQPPREKSERDAYNIEEFGKLLPERHKFIVRTRRTSPAEINTQVLYYYNPIIVRASNNKVSDRYCSIRRE